MNDISPALRGEIERSFGSFEDFLRALSSSESRAPSPVTLTAHRGEKLQLSLDKTPQGTVLYSTHDRWDGTLVSARYRNYLLYRPRRPFD